MKEKGLVFCLSLKKKIIKKKNLYHLAITHNSGPLHKVIRAGATRLSIKASLMPRRISCNQADAQERQVGEKKNKTKNTEGPPPHLLFSPSINVLY